MTTNIKQLAHIVFTAQPKDTDTIHLDAHVKWSGEKSNLASQTFSELIFPNGVMIEIRFIGDEPAIEVTVSQLEDTLDHDHPTPEE